jgi:hypothetical protein
VTEYVWTELRDRAVRAFNGDTPHGETEERLLTVFQENPVLVDTTMQRVADLFTAGKVSRPWPYLAKACEDAVKPGADVTVTDVRERDRAVARAEQWLRAAGGYLPAVVEGVSRELLDELFGDRGLLRNWASDQLLRQRMLDVWDEVRPWFENTEWNANARAVVRRGQRQKAAQKGKA